MFYYVANENVDFEKADPGSQPRLPGPECDEPQDPPLFLWNQALYIIAQLLTSNLLHINELDPIRRYLPSYNRPKRPGRYSAFQVMKYDFEKIKYIRFKNGISYFVASYVYIVQNVIM